MTDFKQIEQLMISDGYSHNEINIFQKLCDQYADRDSQKVEWEKISSPSSQLILPYENLPVPDDSEIRDLLKKVSMCRLNGGLGTSMGCVGPKSAIEVREGASFLDLIVSQVKSLNQKYQVDVPLILMNSFNTDEDTNKIIEKYVDQAIIETFYQNNFPRLRKDTLLPLSKEDYGQASMYPPGHGDFFDSIEASGLLDKLIAQGKKYMFIANADNLGAGVDFKILKLMSKKNIPYIMEVTKKTRADVKGGTLITSEGQPLRLLEIAQVPKEHVDDFKDIKKFKVFNTNNIWIDLEALKHKLESKTMKLDLIINNKSVEKLPVIQNAEKLSVIQLETAIGSGINNFEGSMAVEVPRIRFVPIKRTDDLLLLQSNIFNIKNGSLSVNPKRGARKRPMIRLGKFFQSVDEYYKRFETIPDILDLELLTVVGNVYFGKNIKLKGNVTIVCDWEGELHIPDSAALSNKVITGKLRVVDF